MNDEIFYVDVGEIIGGVEGQLLAERLLEMYRCWAAAQGIGFELIDKTPAFGGGVRSAKFSLTGTGRAAFAALHDGAHTLIRIPPDDCNQRRHMSIAGVRSTDDPALPLSAEMADWGDERRRYICDPYYAINDTRFGKIDVDPAAVFAGDFSALIATRADPAV